MISYYDAGSSCYDGFGSVSMADGSFVTVKNLVVGDMIKARSKWKHYLG